MIEKISPADLAELTALYQAVEDAQTLIKAAQLDAAQHALVLTRKLRDIRRANNIPPNYQIDFDGSVVAQAAHPLST